MPSGPCAELGELWDGPGAAAFFGAQGVVGDVEELVGGVLAALAAVAGGLIGGAVEEGGGPGVGAWGEGGVGRSGNGVVEAAQEFGVEFGGGELGEPLGGGGLVGRGR